MKKFFLLFIIFLCIENIFSEDINNLSDYELYIYALENLTEENISQSKEAFSLLINKFPESQYYDKAKIQLKKLAKKRDTSGIVPFYAGSLATYFYTCVGFTTIILEQNDNFVNGIAGLTGVGLGFWTSWMMSKDINMSSAQDLWIETSQIITAFNSSYLFNLIAGDFDNWSDSEYDFKIKLYTGIEIISNLSSRNISYNFFKDRSPSPGKISFALSSYLWIKAYTWSTLFGIIESDSDIFNYSSALLIPDISFIAAIWGWDKLEWSQNRIGLINLGGIGGGLVGSSIVLILSGDNDNLSSNASVAIVMGSSIIGHGITILLTRNMAEEKPLYMDSKKQKSLFFIPHIGINEFGIQGYLKL